MVDFFKELNSFEQARLEIIIRVAESLHAGCSANVQGEPGRALEG